MDNLISVLFSLSTWGLGFWRWFRNFKGANFTQASPAGPAELNKDDLQDRAGHTAIQPEAIHTEPIDSSSGITRIIRRKQNAAAVRRAAVTARVAAMVFALVAFSVLAADRNKGWALDSSVLVIAWYQTVFTARY